MALDVVLGAVDLAAAGRPAEVATGAGQARGERGRHAMALHVAVDRQPVIGVPVHRVVGLAHDLLARQAIDLGHRETLHPGP